VTDDRHDEIARRLREEGAARAPDRLRADVMLQVRAEPRPRRIRPRRSYWRPLGSLAAAACLVAAAAFGVTRIDTGSGGVSGAGGTSAAAEARIPGALQTPSFPASRGDTTTQPLEKTPVSGAASAQFGSELRAVPAPLRNAYAHRFALAAPLRRAFAPLEPRLGRGSHTR
jgi:negative regulator of sigma E activity